MDEQFIKVIDVMRPELVTINGLRSV